MTYRALFEMKFKQKISTLELEKKFPREKLKILNLALLEVPIHILESIVKNQKQLFRLLSLRKNLFTENQTGTPD